MEPAAPDLTVSVRRTSVEIDIGVLDAAKAALGTVTIRDTIDAALRQAIRRAKLARAAEIIAAGGLDVISPEELAELRRVEF